MRLLLLITGIVMLSSLAFAQGGDSKEEINKQNIVEPEFIRNADDEGIEIYKQAQLNKGKADKFLKEGKYKRAVQYYDLAIKSCLHHSSPYY